MAPALAGGFFTAEPPGKPPLSHQKKNWLQCFGNMIKPPTYQGSSIMKVREKNLKQRQTHSTYRKILNMSDG